MGLGRRTFAPGEVLTASNVMNYLMDQSVMNFADDGARGSALGTAAAEGMFSYLNDTNSFDVYESSGWRTIASVSANALTIGDTSTTGVTIGGTSTTGVTIGGTATTTTISGRISATHYPFAVATGSATISQTGSNASVSVTFPSGRFTAAPIVSTNQPTAAGVQQKLNNRAINITSTGCTLFTSTGDGTSTTSTHAVTYIAIQM